MSIGTKTLGVPAGGTLIQSGTLAARPAAGVADRYYWATDIMEMYRDTGAYWELVASPMPFDHLIVANYYASPMIADFMGGNVNIPADDGFAQFYPCRKTATYDRIAVDIQTGDAAGSYRLGIYADNLAGYPGALIQDAGAVVVNPAGIRFLALTPAVQLIAGLKYWLLALSNTNIATIYVGTWPGVAHPYLGSPTMIRISNSAVFGALAYGALPDPFPAGWAYSHYAHAIGLRLLSVP